LGIRDILVWIRIRILGYVPLTNGDQIQLRIRVLSSLVLYTFYIYIFLYIFYIYILYIFLLHIFIL
jgi:hypothetical protein